MFFLGNVVNVKLCIIYTLWLGDDLMGKQNEIFRKMHPEQFSDSKIIKKGNLDRDFLDFYFETLTSKSLEKEFEDFCRKIAEFEICPNLLSQTGPTGGGDSKVDSETYPVSELISTLWYYGNGNKAATERWAFAISAKKDWKSKVKSDVAKIAKVNNEEKRGYSKVFFMSNQYVSDKKRADAEDELRKIYALDIRILDRTWLLDKALKNRRNTEIVIKCFGLSDSFYDEKEVGERDYKREKELKDIEEQLLNDDLKPTQIVALSQRSLVLARELEFSKQEIINLIERNERIAKENGNDLDIAYSVYDAAWTIYWWYFDPQLYYEYYKRYEEIVLNKDNVNLFKNLVTLWMNLYSISFEEESILLDNHTECLQNIYHKFISDPSKPNTTIEAKAAYQLMRIFLGDKPNEIIDDIIQIVNDSFGHIDLDLYPLSRFIQEIPVLEEGERYNELFELIVTTMSEQKKKSEVSMMLAKRGSLLKDKKPYEALSYFSRSLMGFYNDDNKNQLIKVIMEMGYIFEKMGLLWAARNFYYYDFCLSLNQYMKFGEINPALFISANSLKFIELRLGHILYAINFDSLAKISEHIYPQKIEYKEEMIDNFDYILAIQILRTNYEVEKSLGRLPNYLEKHDLIFSSAAMKYELGYYDDVILASLNNSKETFDDLIEKWTSQPALKELKYMPWYGVESERILKANVLGCSIELMINGEYEHGEVEIGATILATIESFFGTGVSNELISLNGKIQIKLCYESELDVFIKGNIHDENPSVILISFKNYDSENIIAAQNEFSSFMIELIGMVMSIMFPYSKEMSKIEKMVKSDAAFERSQTFSNSIFYGMEILGKNTFSFSSVLQDFDDLPMLRTKKSDITNVNTTECKRDRALSNKLNYNESPKKIKLDNISNEDIITSSIINIPLWNISDWKGIAFMASPTHEFPPILSLVFMKKNCKNIFEEWIKEIGQRDSNNKIGIRIIKGINKKHPYWYRVAIGQLEFPSYLEKEQQIYAMQSRLHTMEPDNDRNIKMFERELKISNKFMMCPSYFQDISSQPQVFNELVIHKSVESIIICDACDIKEDDLLSVSAILPTDDPIIPQGKENAPILRIIERKKCY